MIEIPPILELAWTHAPPGREAAERNEILRELHRSLAQEERSIRLPPDRHFAAPTHTDPRLRRSPSVRFKCLTLLGCDGVPSQ
jgi:hypothetical protein